MVLKELICKQFLLWKGVVIMKELISTDSTLGGMVVILKELILTISIMTWCGDLERTDF